MSHESSDTPETVEVTRPRKHDRTREIEVRHQPRNRRHEDDDRTARAERDTHDDRAHVSQQREEHFDQQITRSPREKRVALFVDALRDAGAVPLWTEGAKDRQTVSGWSLNGHLLVTIESEHGFNVLQSLAPGVNSTDAVLDVIKRYSYPKPVTLRAEAQQVIEAFDRVDWEILTKFAEDRATDHGPGGCSLIENLLDLITLLGADNRLREACGITRPPFASQHDKAKS